MKNVSILKSLKAVLAISTVTFVVACSSTAQGTRNVAGTQDMGGGNGLAEGKVYDAYIVDITKLKAFRQYVAPALRKMDAPEIPADRGFQNIAKFKTWYFIPASLAPLSKEAIGFSMSRGKNIQYALQTKDKIVVDNKLFSKMSTEAQGQLIMHELVMSLYLVKYQTFSELGRSACAASGNCEANENKELTTIVDGRFPPMAYKPLSKEDYEYIRRTTAWLLENATNPNVTTEQIALFLRSNNFDRRLFKAKLERTTRDIVIQDTAAYMVKTLERSRVLGTLPNRCKGRKTKIEFDCEISLVKSQRDSMNVYEIHLKSEKINRIITVSPTVTRSTIALTSNDDAFVSANLFLRTLDQCQLGNVVQETVLVLSTNRDFMSKEFEVNSPMLDLKGIVFIPEVVTEATPDGWVTLEQPRVRSLENDTIVALDASDALEEAELLERFSFTKFKKQCN